MDALVAAAEHPFAKQLGVVLRTWKPRFSETEKPYQHSLSRNLRKALPAADPRLEVPLRAQGIPLVGRIDILLGRCVLIESKRHLTTSTAQKTVGQVEMYSRIWQKNGPVVLVLCDTDRDFAVAFLEPSIRRLRSDGHAVVAILALT